MPRAVTLQTIANELGCSAKTVSNAYNQPDQLSAATRERVLEVAARLGYPGPDPVAAGLRRGRVSAIGFAYPNRLPYAFSDPFMSDMLAGIGGTLEQTGTGLLLIPASATPERAAASITGAVIDALIVGSLADDDPLLAIALGRPLPTVVIDQPYPDRLAVVAGDRPVPAYVGIDDRAAARSAAEHVIELGHHRIGIVSFGLHRASTDGLVPAADRAAATFAVTRQRLLGYRDATDAAGIDWSSVAVAAGPSSTVRDGFERAGILLDLEPRPTALLCLSDALAEGAIQAGRYPRTDRSRRRLGGRVRRCRTGTDARADNRRPARVRQRSDRGPDPARADRRHSITRTPMAIDPAGRQAQQRASAVSRLDDRSGSDRPRLPDRRRHGSGPDATALAIGQAKGKP